jgi:hypothetical protein
MRSARIQMVTAPGGRVNDDGMFVSGNAAWIVDGATSVTPQRYCPGDGDVSWFVQTLSSYLAQELAADCDTVIGLRRALTATRDMFLGLIGPARLGSLPADLPSASLSVARIRDGSLEIANIGDCKTIVRTRAGQTRPYGTSDVERYDRKLVEFIKTQLGMGKNYINDIWPELLPMIRSNREMKNKPGGYWVADLSNIAATGLQEFKISMIDIDAIMMMTDGFYRAVDVYAMYTYENLIDAVRAEGLQTIVEKIRQIEIEDAAGTRYPRIKLQDDATAIFIELSRWPTRF